MATWTSRGLRGSALEDYINHTNEQYRNKGLALIQKIPTPITPVRIDKEHRHITLAYFDQRSTVDYIGAVQGIPVCFDAKECAADTFPLQNGGIAFLLILYTGRTELYYMRFQELKRFWERMEKGGRKSIRYEELDPEFFFTLKNGCMVPYLDEIQKDLDKRE